MMAEINSYETDFLVDEIFQRKTYLKHGIQIPGSAVVLDVGANIGVFARFVKKNAPESRVFCFEPSKQAFKALELNTAEFGEDVKSLNIGIGAESSSKNFTYYPGYSVISGFHADRELDQAVIIEGEMKFKRQSWEEVSKRILPRFEAAEVYPCPIMTLSEVIEANGLTQVDLLKVDAEKSEKGILTGIKADDWPKIQQVVVEIHGEANMSWAKELLLRKGMEVVVEGDALLGEAGIYGIYARRSD